MSCRKAKLVVIQGRTERVVPSMIPGASPSKVIFYLIVRADDPACKVVERRYSEFNVLRSKLMNETAYKGLLIPELPEKNGFMGLFYQAD